ncbi:MAG: TonB-dependent receptor [Saprospiraceae bacterium]|nr:TonB-dependent receptor [Saprospiraceae bacterium]
MMRLLFIHSIRLALLLAPVILPAQESTTLHGIVRDEVGNPLAGAAVQILDGPGTTTDRWGKFSLSIPSNDVILEVRYLGYTPWRQTLPAPLPDLLHIQLEPMAFALQTLELIGTWVDPSSPFTSKMISGKELASRNQGQDIPWLLRNTPGVVASSDAGTGIGYTGLRIRGSDPTRINVTINGVPLNDAESQAVFWVNTPDFASSVEQIQIQRGVGTSTNGAGAFGASINMQTNTLREKPYGEISNNIGSFGTRRHMVSLGSGLLNNHWSIDGRWSQIHSDGYIDRATAVLTSWSGSLTWQKDNLLIRALAFSGQERTYQSWWGTPQSRLNNDTAAMLLHATNNGFTEAQTQNLLHAGRRYNYYEYPNEVDQYQQTHYQLHLAHAINSHWRWNATLHYTRGSGYFEQYQAQDDINAYGLPPIIIGSDTISQWDAVRRRWLDNHFAGAVGNLRYEKDNLDVHLGGGWNNYLGDHFGRIIWASPAGTLPPDYEYYTGDARKTDGNVFLKTTWKPVGNISLFADLQLRRVDYHTEGADHDLRSYSITDKLIFFNPKAGVSWQLSKPWTAYASVAVGHREPSRKDYVDAPIAVMPRPERLVNTEAGLRWSRSNLSAEVNMYLMDYKDQLVPTGALNDVGATLLTNVPDSWRAGMEFSLAAQLGAGWHYEGNLCLSRNKIKAFEEVLYDYTTGFDEIRNLYQNVDIAFSPPLTTYHQLEWCFGKGFSLAGISRFIARQYLDNTQNEQRSLPSWWVQDLNIVWTRAFKGIGTISASLQVNNVLDAAYSNNGYTYSYIYGETITENFYYPQAGRHFFGGLRIQF